MTEDPTFTVTHPTHGTGVWVYRDDGQWERTEGDLDEATSSLVQRFLDGKFRPGWFFDYAERVTFNWQCGYPAQQLREQHGLTTDAHVPQSYEDWP